MYPKMILSFILWPILAVLDLFMSLISYPVAPIAALFGNKETGQLPKLFWLFMTPDNTLYGDNGHQKRWAGWMAKHPGFFGRYVVWVAWLWRNKAYNFAWNVLGVTPSKVLYSHTSGPQGQIEPYIERPKVHSFVITNNSWCLWWCTPTFKGRYLRVYIGWKLKNAPFTLPQDRKFMLAFHINPFRPYHGMNE